MSYRPPDDVSQRPPEDVLKTFLYYSLGKANKRLIDKVSLFGLSINECLITKMASTDAKGGNISYLS